MFSSPRHVTSHLCFKSQLFFASMWNTIVPFLAWISFFTPLCDVFRAHCSSLASGVGSEICSSFSMSKYETQETQNFHLRNSRSLIRKNRFHENIGETQLLRKVLNFKKPCSVSRVRIRVRRMESRIST